MPKAKKAASRNARNRRNRQKLAALANLRDEHIDTSDIPELPVRAWKNAVRGRFYRPLKKAVSLRLDTDVLAWLKREGEGYQTRANKILRERMLKDLKRWA